MDTIPNIYLCFVYVRVSFVFNFFRWYLYENYDF